MMILTGAPSLSAFRRKKLLSTLQQTVPSTVSVYAEYVHFAELTQPLSESAVETLQALLTYGPREEKTVHQRTADFSRCQDQELFHPGRARPRI